MEHYSNELNEALETLKLDLPTDVVEEMSMVVLDIISLSIHFEDTELAWWSHELNRKMLIKFDMLNGENLYRGLDLHSSLILLQTLAFETRKLEATNELSNELTRLLDECVGYVNDMDLVNG